MTGNEVLFDVLALLLATVAVVPLLQRFGVPSVLGYLVAGIALGPYTPGPVVDLETARPLAEFGVVFLLFAIGLELPLARLRAMRRYIFGLGLLQVVVTAALLGGLASSFGLGAQAALIVGVTLAFSSTATVLAMLVEKGEVVTHQGRVAVSILILQDLAVVPVLAALPLLASHSRDIGSALGLAAAKATLAVAAIYLLGRLLLRPAYGWVSTIRTPEVFSAANLLLVLAVGWATAEAGMSMALGAFLAGLLLADSRYRHQVEADIEPFRGLLLGLFFMTVGMSIDLPFVAGEGGRVLLVTALCLGIKALVIAVLCRALGLALADGLKVGLLLAQIGEFAFVVFARAMELKLLDHATGQVLVAAVALSMVLTPALAGLGRRLAARLTEHDGDPYVPTGGDELSGHVVIAGYGRGGRAIGRVLADHGVRYVALDLDVERVAQSREAGLPVFYGDASRSGVLRSVGIERARAAIVTVNQPRLAERALAAIRQAAPELPVIVRAHDSKHQKLLGGAGATAVVPETMEASLQMAGLALRSAGIAAEDVDRTLHEHRRKHIASLS